MLSAGGILFGIGIRGIRIFGDTHVIAKNASLNQQVEKSLAPIETSTTKDLQKGREYA